MNSVTRVLLAAIALSGLSVLLHAQTSGVRVDQPRAGDRNVTGQGVPGSTPLTVYDVSNGRRNYMGRSASMDQHGFYAVAVNPPVNDGQKIIVVDSQGRSSLVATV